MRKGENIAAEEISKEKVLQVLCRKIGVYRLQGYQNTERIHYRKGEDPAASHDRGMCKTPEVSE